MRIANCGLEDRWTNKEEAERLLGYGGPEDNNVVGAGLVPAHDVMLSDDGSIVGVLDHDVVAVNKRATTRVAPTLGDVIGTYKSVNRIRQYILNNPRQWREVTTRTCNRETNDCSSKVFRSSFPDN